MCIEMYHVDSLYFLNFPTRVIFYLLHANFSIHQLFLVKRYAQGNKSFVLKQYWQFLIHLKGVLLAALCYTN